MGAERVRPDEPSRERDVPPGPAAKRPEPEAGRAEPVALALQQQVGNRAVQRLVTGGHIQRYAIHDEKANWQGLGTAMKVSDDGKMAVQDIDLYPEGKGRAHQEFFATKEVIASATQALAGLRSVYEIHPGPPLRDPRPGTDEAMFKVEVENKVIGDLGHGAAAPLNCNENTAALLGIDEIGTELNSRAQLRASLTKRRLFGKETVTNVDTSPAQGGFNPAKAEALTSATGKKDTEAANEAYAKMTVKKKERAAKELGINQFARAGQGGAYGVFGASPHFAPVLAASGGDEVTLESHYQNQTTKGPAKDEIPAGDAVGYNPEWYFQMYGPIKPLAAGGVDDQTFYGRHAATAKGKADPLLMVVAYGKLPAKLAPDATERERRSLVEGVLAANGRRADKARKTMPAEKEMSTALAVLERDAKTVPKEAADLAGWMRDWAVQIESVIDGLADTMKPIPAKLASGALHFGRRTVRRAAQLLE